MGVGVDVAAAETPRLRESSPEEGDPSAPGAIAAAKELIFGVAARTLEGSFEFTAEAIANARASDEGQAGMKAFLSREKAPWITTHER